MHSEPRETVSPEGEVVKEEEEECMDVEGDCNPPGVLEGIGL